MTAWDRVSFHLPSTYEGPELASVAANEYRVQHPGRRIGGITHIETNTRCHWFDIWIQQPKEKP